MGIVRIDKREGKKDMTFDFSEEYISIAQESGIFFCPRCDSLLKRPSGSKFKCKSCHFKFNSDFLKTITHKTTSKENTFFNPEINVAEEKKEKLAVIDENCPKCNHPEMTFFTMQLRSADEGATIFYSCPKCNHKFSVNN